MKVLPFQKICKEKKLLNIYIIYYAVNLRIIDEILKYI